MKATISQQIESEFRIAISQGKEPSFCLTLLAIAEHYQVSIQPVRTAVDLLLKEQGLLWTAQGRLVMNPKKKGESVSLSPPVKVVAQPDIQVRLRRNDYSTFTERGRSFFARGRHSRTDGDWSHDSSLRTNPPYVIEQSGNRFIKGFFEQFGAYHTAVFNFASLEGEFLAGMATQHHTILEALLVQDYSRARRFLSKHIRIQRSNVAQLLKQKSDEVSI